MLSAWSRYYPRHKGGGETDMDIRIALLGVTNKLQELKEGNAECYNSSAQVQTTFLRYLVIF